MIIAERERIMLEEEEFRGNQDASALSHNMASLNDASNANTFAADAQAYGTFSQTQNGFNTQFPGSSKNAGSIMSQKESAAGDSTAGGKLPTAAATGTMSNFPKFVASSGSHMMRSSAYASVS
jgi:hypothetical protein